jgi:hypothetical protein
VTPPDLTELRPGHGVWVKLGTPFDRAFPGRGTVTDRAHRWVLDAGWNCLGNPFDSAVEGRAMRFGESVQPVLFAYDADRNTYEVVGDPRLAPGLRQRLRMWEGFWAYSESDGGILRFYPPAVAPLSVDSEPPRPPSWTVRVVAAAGHVADASTLIGQGGERAVLAVPNPPPAPGPFIDLSVRPKSGQRECAISIQAGAPDSLEWEMMARSNVADRPVTLTWPDLSQVPSDLVLYLHDLETDRRTYMRTAESYTYRSATGESARHFRIKVARREAGALVLTSSALYEGGGRAATIALTLSRPAQVTARVLNVAGRPVATICTGKEANGATNHLAWDLRSDGGTRVPTGHYLCVVEAMTEDGLVARSVCSLRVTGSW